MFKSKARITAIGSYVPEKRLTNKDLEKMLKRMMNGLLNVPVLKNEELHMKRSLLVI